MKLALEKGHLYTITYVIIEIYFLNLLSVGIMLSVGIKRSKLISDRASIPRVQRALSTAARAICTRARAVSQVYQTDDHHRRPDRQRPELR